MIVDCPFQIFCNNIRIKMKDAKSFYAYRQIGLLLSHPMIVVNEKLSVWVCKYGKG